MWGGSGTGRAVRAGLPGRCPRRPRRPGRRPGHRRARAGRAARRRGRPAGAARGRPAAAGRRPTGPGRWRSSTRPATRSSAAPTRPGTVSARCGPRPWPVSGAGRRRSRCSRRRWPCCAGGARRASSGPALRRLGEITGGAGLEHLREAVGRPRADRPPSWRRPAPSTPWAGPRTCPTRRPSRCCGSAVARARDCGAQHGVRGRLRGAGRTRPRRRCGACDLPAPVSETVRRILDLADTGLGVHEVAQRLFLTPGTVRAALEHAQVRGRRHRAGALHQ